MHKSRKFLRALKNAIKSPDNIKAFRSALFFASLMVILEHQGLLEWLDVFMLRVVAGFTQDTVVNNRPEALVFTIQEELFETAFKSRTPINREIFVRYLWALDESFSYDRLKKFNVLAIDYDLSPNSFDFDEYKKTKECIINDPEEERGQKKLKEFFLTLLAMEKNRLD
jgi:hypothetical protein